MESYAHQLSEIKLLPSKGGRFEVVVDDSDLIYSKLATQRHAEPGEIEGLVAARLGR